MSTIRNELGKTKLQFDTIQNLQSAGVHQAHPSLVCFALLCSIYFIVRILSTVINFSAVVPHELTAIENYYIAGWGVVSCAREMLESLIGDVQSNARCFCLFSKSSSKALHWMMSSLGVYERGGVLIFFVIACYGTG